MDQLKMMDFWMKYKPLPHFLKNCTWIGWIEFDLIFPAILFLTFQLKKNLNLFLSRWQTFSFNNESWEAKKNVTEAFMSLLFCFTTLSLLYLRDCAKHLTVVKKVLLALQVIFSSSKGLSLVVWDFELCKNRIGRTWAKSSGSVWHYQATCSSSMKMSLTSRNGQTNILTSSKTRWVGPLCYKYR